MPCFFCQFKNMIDNEKVVVLLLSAYGHYDDR